MIELKVVNNRLYDYGLPAIATPGSAGYDLRAAIDEPMDLQPELSYKIPTGVALNLGDRALAALVFSRSGLAATYNLTLQNGVGVIDSDYQGEISVLIRNEGEELYRVNPGDRVAQLVFIPIAHPAMSIVEEFSGSTRRGINGFGHTGISTPLLHGDPSLSAMGNSHEPGTQDDVPALAVGRVSPGGLLGTEGEFPPPEAWESEEEYTPAPQITPGEAMEGYDGD